MDLFLHYISLPGALTQGDVIEALERAMDGAGAVTGGTETRIDMDLDDERVNPKLTQGAVLTCVRALGFGRGTRLELGGLEVDVSEQTI